MNIHIGSWIVPLLFTIFAFVFMSTKYGKLKRDGRLTIADARKSGFSDDDEIVQALVLILFLGLFTAASLVVWLVWACVKLFLCGA